MKKVKIVADSSANLFQLQNADFAAAPLKIITAEKEFIDDAALDVANMVHWFDSYKGKSKTSCPNPGDWLEAMLKNALPHATVKLHPYRALCSYYAEKGGLLVGFEKL